MVAREHVGAEPPGQERGVAGLFADLARETSRLFRQEMALARAELVDKVRLLGSGAIELAIGGVILFAGFLALLEAAIVALALVLPLWAAALVVGGVTVILGAILLLKGRADMGPRRLVPDRTLRSLREDAEWAREQMR